MKNFLLFSLLCFLFVGEIQSQCIDNQSLTVTPEPDENGCYACGQTVEFCYEFTYHGTYGEYAHSVIPLLISGWDLSSLQQ